MSFFQVPDPEPNEPDEDPSWQPSTRELGRLVVYDRVLAESDDALVLLRSAVVYSNGFELFIEPRWRPNPEDPLGPERFHDVRSDAFLRIGLAYADGLRGTNLDEDWDDEPSGKIVLSGHRSKYWVRPLPPPGPVTVVIEWPAYGIAETHTDVELG